MLFIHSLWSPSALISTSGKPHHFYVSSSLGLMDLFRYDSAFGSPVARIQGIGYIEELVARLTHTPIETHNTSTNATLDDNPITFPLDQSLYVDATHEVVVLNGMHI